MLLWKNITYARAATLSLHDIHFKENYAAHLWDNK